jgi:alpha-methylacyl-CoA racemase
MSGPLAGIRILEIAGLGAAPYGCMMLADMGAEVVRIERPGGQPDTPEASPQLRNRRSMALDLKQPDALAIILEMVTKADAIVEAFRPGVAERLGLGPEVCLQRNPRLVYARMTGWGQSGPLAQTAGHDLNFIGLAGVLQQIGPTGGKPVVPLNVIGDFGGGGLLLAFGIACALLEARGSGKGQVLDAAMLDGAASFMAMFFGYRALGQFDDRTGAHLLGGGAHYYDVYETLDRKFLSVAPIEPQFYSAFLQKLGLSEARWLAGGYPNVDAAARARVWPELKSELDTIFRTRTRDQWVALFEGCDVCVTPVLTVTEALAHPHNQARQTFIDVDGVPQNAPAPRFSRTVPDTPRPPPKSGADTRAVLEEWGIDPAVIAKGLAEP